MTCWDLVAKSHTASTSPTETSQQSRDHDQEEFLKDQRWKEELQMLRQIMAALEGHPIVVWPPDVGRNLTVIIGSTQIQTQLGPSSGIHDPVGSPILD